MQIVLTDADRLVLESYKNLAAGLSEYLGEGYEIVLHSLEDLEHSVIFIINGHYTGREVGCPITNIALSMLKKMEQEDSKGSISYFTKTSASKPLKSSTIAIKGAGNRTIGLLCINFYLATPYYSIINSFFSKEEEARNEIEENFSDSIEDMVKKSISGAREMVMKDNTISSTNRNHRMIQYLFENGIFNFKDAVETVAQELGISKSTVYMHIRRVRL